VVDVLVRIKFAAEVYFHLIAVNLHDPAIWRFAGAISRVCFPSILVVNKSSGINGSHDGRIRTSQVLGNLPAALRLIFHTEPFMVLQSRVSTRFAGRPWNDNTKVLDEVKDEPLIASEFCRNIMRRLRLEFSLKPVSVHQLRELRGSCFHA
jgi:hypothetical protein